MIVQQAKNADNTTVAASVLSGRIRISRRRGCRFQSDKTVRLVIHHKKRGGFAHTPKCGGAENYQNGAGKTIYSDLQFLAKFELAGIHFAAVRFVVVAAEVKHSVKDKLLDLAFERESV